MEVVLFAERRVKVELRIKQTGDSEADRRALMEMSQARGQALDNNLQKSLGSLVARLPEVVGPSGKSILVSGGERMKAQLADGADLPRLQQAAYDQIYVAFGNTEFDDSEIVTKMKAEMADREEVPARGGLHSQPGVAF